MPERIGVAMLGAGYRANDHLKTLSRLDAFCRIVGVCDTEFTNRV